MAVGKKITDLTASGSLKDTDLAIVHDGNGTKRSTLTQISEYMGTKFSNPNLLINPDFKINQRGKSEYAYQDSGATQYTVDRFRVVFLNVKTASDGLILNANGTNAGGGYISQVLEDAVKGDTILSIKVSAVAGTIEFRNLNSADAGDTVTISSDGVYTIKGTNTKKVIFHILKGSSCKIEWIKLEHGSIATPFVAPNPAEELAKCQRYFIVLPYILTAIEINNALYIKHTELMKMRTDGTVVIVGENKNIYIRFEGQKLKRSFNTSGNAVFSKKGDLKLLLNPIDNFYESKVVGIDINDVKIQIDAEIY